jgi:hypothetical protein
MNFRVKGTPWNNVAVRLLNGDWILTRKKVAEETKCKLTSEVRYGLELAYYEEIEESNRHILLNVKI